MPKPLLVIFIGFPGSGKTYFATQLAEKLHAVTLNSDALRLSMFGSLERIEELRESDNARLYVDVFRAMDYATKQILQTGHSVICDAQQTKRENRRDKERLAAEVGALPILVWVKTNPEVAFVRGQERQADSDSHQYTADKMRYLIDRFEKVTDLPEASENVIEISGELPFEEQYEIFKREVEKFHE